MRLGAGLRIRLPPSLAVAAAAALAAATSASRAAEPQFDWCAPIVARPVERFADRANCVPKWTLAELARAKVLYVTAEQIGTGGSKTNPHDVCLGETSVESNAKWIRSVREAVPSGAPAPFFVAFVRFDLIGPVEVYADGFDPAFYVRTDRSWDRVRSFFADDRSPDCAGKCRILEPGFGAPGVFPVARALSRSPASPGDPVYYLVRAAHGMHEFVPGWALADLGNPQYRRWRAARMKELLGQGGFDAVDLNHKLHQYRPRRFGRPSEHWIAGREVEDVTSLNATGDGYWTAPPRGYGYPEYVAGWSAMARDLREAGVPYTVLLDAGAWTGTGYDDPSSPADESAAIREVARGARLVALDAGGGPIARLRRPAAEAELRAAGVEVLEIDTSCGRPGAVY